MTTRDEIIALAVAHGANTAFDHAEQLESFYQAAQRQAYERAADAVQDSYNSRGKYADDTIRALIEGERE